ncbi:MAG: MarR family transcriptional regulator [Labilithrix sp.]|nr:MarR family transcriptional regulator [Labilithrix sp.]
MERRLFLLMFRAHRALTSYGNAQTYAELGVSASQLAALHHVAKHPGCSLTQLADLLDLNKSAVTGLVARMERDRVLRREPDENDGRASVLHVTARGDDVRARSSALTRRLTAELTEGFDPKEMEVVMRFLNAVIERSSASPSARDDER